MKNAKVTGKIYAWSYGDDCPEKPFIIMARTENGDVRMTVELNKADCEDLIEALEEHLGID